MAEDFSELPFGDTHPLSLVPWHSSVQASLDWLRCAARTKRSAPTVAIALVVSLYRSGRINYLRPRFGEVGFAALGSQAVLTDSHFYFVD